MNEFVILYAITIAILIFDSWKLGSIQAQLEIIREDIDNKE